MEINIYIPLSITKQCLQETENFCFKIILRGVRILIQKKNGSKKKRRKKGGAACFRLCNKMLSV